jgi:hypothetical protein
MRMRVQRVSALPARRLASSCRPLLAGQEDRVGDGDARFINDDIHFRGEAARWTVPRNVIANNIDQIQERLTPVEIDG